MYSTRISLAKRKTWSLDDRDHTGADQSDRQKKHCKIGLQQGEFTWIQSDLRRLEPELGHVVALGSFSGRLSVPTWCGGGGGRMRRPQFRERPLLLLGPAERRRRREDDGMGRRSLSHFSPRNCCRCWRTLDWLRPRWAFDMGGGREGGRGLSSSLSQRTAPHRTESLFLPLSST